MMARFQSKDIIVINLVRTISMWKSLFNYVALICAQQTNQNVTGIYKTQEPERAFFVNGLSLFAFKLIKVFIIVKTRISLSYNTIRAFNNAIFKFKRKEELKIPKIRYFNDRMV